MVHLESVSFSYSSAHPVLAAVDLDLGPGWHGVVGPNGAGKTTLLELIAGLRVPDAGSVTRSSGVPPVLCRQTVDRVDPTIRWFSGSWEPDHFALRGRLRLDPDDLGRWQTLSPGERKRWQIGAALATAPDLLLLDEPTNHVDEEGRRLLSSALERFSGTGLVVSHDRELLSRLTVTTVWVDAGTVEHRSGPYPVAAAEREREREAIVGRRQALVRERRRLERRAAVERAELAGADARRAREMRAAAGRDHDTTSAANTGRSAAGSAAASRRITVLGDQARRLGAAADAIAVRRRHGGPIRFEGAAAPRPTLVRWSGSLQAGDRVLAPDLDVSVERGSRIHLAGPNGSGKSTLLDRLARAWDLPAERLLHLPQEYSEDGAAAVLEGARSGAPDRLGRIMQLVARLGTDPDALLASEHPSPGEVRKLAIAEALGREAWCLLLDEPTNHLDLPAVERLEEALSEYPGAVVIVSHDVGFAASITTERWSLAHGGLVPGDPGR